MINDLIGRTADAGFMFELTDGGGAQLVRTRRGAEMSPELLADLRANRDAVLSHLAEACGEQPQTCRVCGRDVSDPEYRARLAGPLFCDRGGSRGNVTDGHGRRHEPSERCPFKEAG